MPIRLLLTAALAFAAMPAAALAHPELVASRPADGDTLSAPPTTIRLLFSEPVEAALAQIRLLGAGEELTLVVRADPSDPNALLADVPDGREQGAHQVVWQVAAADGHRIQGTFIFVVETGPGEDPAVPEPPPPTGPEPAPPPAFEPADGGPTFWPLGLLRGAAIGFLLALAGTLGLAAWLARPGTMPRAALGLAVTATLLLVAHALAWVAYVSPRGLDPTALGAALGTLPGRLEAIRLLLAALALIAIAPLRRPRLAAVLAIGAVLVTAGLGHAATQAPWWSVPGKALHVVAAAAWLGGLLHLATGGLRGATPLTEARRVSSVALGAVLVVAASGALQAFLNLASPADLVRSAYGILVLAKTAGLAGLVLFGARNRYRLIPKLAGEGTGAALERSVRWEIAVMALVVLVAGLLAYTPLPSE